MLLTRVALMAPPLPDVAPQLSPRPLGIRLPNRASANSMLCSATEPIKGTRTLPAVGKMSTSAAILLQRLGHDAHVSDAGLLHRIHDRCERAKGHVLVSANKYGLAFGVPYLLMQLRADLVDVDGVIIQEHPLLAVNGDDQPLLGNFLDRLRMWDRNLNARLQNRGGHHKDDQQHQHHVHQRCDVDVGQRALRTSLCVGECHQRRSTLSAWRALPLWARSTSLISSRLKSSMRAPNSRMCWVNML